MKRTISLILLNALVLGFSQTLHASTETGVSDEMVTELVREISVTINGSKLRVQNAEGLTVTVYNITGVKAASFKVDSEDKTVTLNLEKGCYIVKVGNVARKVTVR